MLYRIKPDKIILHTDKIFLVKKFFIILYKKTLRRYLS